MIKLNIGCGPNVFPFPDWINYDRESVDSYFTGLRHIWAVRGGGSMNDMPESQQKLAKYIAEGGQMDFRIHDIRSGFSQHPDGSVDAIYLGQVIEHLNPIYEVPKMLKECYRMLKPGGVLRITTPDLDVLLKAYAANEMDKFAIEQPDFYKGVDPASQLAMIMYGACGPNCTWKNFEGHMFLFTQVSMKRFLLSAGFKEPIDFHHDGGKSRDAVLAREVFDAGMSHSFITEAVR